MLTHSPVEWGWDRLRLKGSRFRASTPEEFWPGSARQTSAPTLRRIGIGDLRTALARGLEDLAANRDDVIVMCVLYPVVGLILARLAFGYEVVPMLFPLASGFALLGPLAAVGLYEMSRRRELGMDEGWTDAFKVLRAPNIVSIATLGLALIAIFAVWLAVADTLYMLTLGPLPPDSVGQFIHDTFTTRAGWAMIGIGCGIGLLFGLVVLAIGTISFPMLLDRPVDLQTAVGASIRAFVDNPGTMLAWGVVVAAALAIGSIPFFFGLVVVLPVLGHATWHLYRRLVPR
jgi:uncharacterized membrane protein